MTWNNHLWLKSAEWKKQYWPLYQFETTGSISELDWIKTYYCRATFRSSGAKSVLLLRFKLKTSPFVMFNRKSPHRRFLTIGAPLCRTCRLFGVLPIPSAVSAYQYTIVNNCVFIIQADLLLQVTRVYPFSSFRLSLVSLFVHHWASDVKTPRAAQWSRDVPSRVRETLLYSVGPDWRKKTDRSGTYILSIVQWCHGDGL